MRAGSVRCKNTMNILLKNVIDGAASAIAFYLLGYGLAYGVAEDGTGNRFIGTGDFALAQTSREGVWHLWFFQVCRIRATCRGEVLRLFALMRLQLCISHTHGQSRVREGSDAEHSRSHCQQ